MAEIAALLLGLSIFIYLLMILAVVLIAVWVYRDARKRYPEGSSAPILWLLVVLLTGLVGLIVYLVVRPREARPAGS